MRQRPVPTTIGQYLRENYGGRDVYSVLGNALVEITMEQEKIMREIDQRWDRLELLDQDYREWIAAFGAGAVPDQDPTGARPTSPRTCSR
jgi:hypothetical protein